MTNVYSCRINGNRIKILRDDPNQAVYSSDDIGKDTIKRFERFGVSERFGVRMKGLGSV